MPRSPSPGRGGGGERERGERERGERQQHGGSGRDRAADDHRRHHHDRHDRDWRRRSRSRDRRERSRSRDRDRDRDRQRRRSRSRSAERGRGGGDRGGGDRGRSPPQRRSDASPQRRPAGAAAGAGGLPPPPPEPPQQQRIGGPASSAAAGAGAAGTSNGGGRREPLSLEELLRRKKEQQAQEAKPRFLSKAEREALALQRRQQEAAGARAATDDLRLLQRRQQDDEQRRRQQHQREAEAAARDRDRERERELELIRKQYLGGEREKKKAPKGSEKFKFNFEWGADEDTSRDLNPLYQNLHQASLLYGRGMLAGIDRREQKKAAAAVEAQHLAKLRGAAGIAETGAMRQAARDREARADKYDTHDMQVETHWSAKPLSKMAERDWRIFREDFNISYKGNPGVLPLRAWDEAPLPDELRRAIDAVGYEKPSPIQMASIPLGLKQLDVIGVAETGSGKTASFVVPMLCYIMRQPPMTEANSADGPYSVVLAPTRELAQQIEEETVKLARFTTYRVTSVVGGQSIEEQGTKLRRGCEIVIATPGRLLDCIERHYCVLNQCNYVVLDEADRMIDLGFEPQVQAVLEAMPQATLKPEDEAEQLDDARTYRTTYMFSATMPPAVERLARTFMRRPVVVNIGRAGAVTDNVAQRVVMLKENEKPSRLSSELDLAAEKKVIVFVNTKHQCDSVYGHLETAGYHCAVLHGGRTQDQREVAIKGFKDDTYNVLIATDVAGRGIDVPDVALVINYDMAHTIEAYTHRIGRTGRAGRKGTAITFLTGKDADVFYDLKRLLEESKAPVPPELARSEAAKQKPGAVTQKRDAVQYAKK